MQAVLQRMICLNWTGYYAAAVGDKSTGPRYAPFAVWTVIAAATTDLGGGILATRCDGVLHGERHGGPAHLGWIVG